MVASKSSPSLLNKGDPAPVVVRGSAPSAAPERLASSRSVCDLADDVRGGGGGGGGESQRLVDHHHHQHQQHHHHHQQQQHHHHQQQHQQHGGERGATPRLIDIAQGRIHDAGRGRESAAHQHHAPGLKHEQCAPGRPPAGMSVPKEAQCSVSQSVPLYQPSYHQPAPHSQPGYNKHVLSYQPDHHPSIPNHQPQQNSVPTTSRASFKPCHSDPHLIQNYASESKNVPTDYGSHYASESKNVPTDYGSRGRDSRCVAVHSVPGSQTYENVTLLASASLKKEKGGGDGYASHVSAPPLSDQSSFQYDKVARTQDKCPPWAQQSAAGTVRDCAVPAQPRAPPASGDPARDLTSAQPGPRCMGVEHSLGMQRGNPETMKTRLEDFRPNSLPGYLPPRVDCGGDGEGGVAERGYSSSCASARDVEGVGRQLLSQRLSAGGPLNTAQPAQSTTQQRRVPGSLPLPSSSTTTTTTTTSSSSSRNTGQEDKSTSPLASPRASLTSPGGDNPPSASRSPSPRATPLHKDFAVASTAKPPGSSGSSGSSAGRGSGKAVLVRPTPYYNTSTQTELSAYALKTSDPRGVPQCSVQIQVDEPDRQTAPRRGVEEKSIQAGRMSREFLPSELESAPARLRGKGPDQSSSPSEEKGFSPFPFRGMRSIQEKYGVDEEEGERPGPRQESSAFPYVETGDQASIMRQLSEEFYRGSRTAAAGDKAHLDQAFRPIGSGVAAQLSGSQTSVTDPHHDLSSRRMSRQGGQTPPHQDYFSRASPRPLQESKKFKSLSAISHQRETSMPVAMAPRSLAQSHESLNPDPSSAHSRRSPSESGRDSGLFQSASPSPRNNSSAENVSQRHSKVGGAFPHGSGTAGVYGTVSLTQHSRTQSVDSVLSERPAGGQRDRTLTDNSANSDGAKKATAEMIGRKPSMKMAYGVYDDGDALNPAKDSHTGGDPAERGKPTTADPLQLGQIKEEGNPALTPGFKPQRPGELTRHKTHGDISDTAQSLDSWRDDLDKRTGRFQNRTASEQILAPRDRSANKMPESFSSQRPPRLFDGSIDSGVGSEISCRVDGAVTPSETPRSPLLLLDNPTGAELKQIQQQAVLSFLQRKTGISFHSPESSVSESAPSTPRAVQPPPKSSSDPVSELISKTNATLAKRADSLRRTSSISSRGSSLDQVEVHRSRKETEWSRLRSSGSFNYGSDRSSLCSDNTNEDFSVFAPSTPRGSLLEPRRAGEDNQNASTHSASQDNQRSNTDSGVMASATAYQNIPGPPPRRRPPPPPPRSPSPEPGPPPALPPRNYVPRKEEGGGSSKPDPGGEEEEVKVDESKVDFHTVLQQCREKLSPREDAYTAQLRKLDVKFSGLRGSSPTTPPTSMSVLHSRTPTGISTSYKRQPALAQEATPPGVSTAPSSVSLAPSVSSARASSPRHFSSQDAAPVAESHISVTLSCHSKEPITSEVAVKVAVDRDTKPLPAPVGPAKPPQLPERTSAAAAAPPPLREQKPAPSRADLLSLPRSEAASSLPKDRTVPDFHAKVSNWQFLPPTPPEVSSRERKLVDGHAQHPGKTDSGSASPCTDSSRSPAGKRREVPLPPPPPPSPGKEDQGGVGVVDPSHLPPPPPELLGDSSSGGGHFVPGDQEKPEPFADDSYGAYRNRGSRQVGTYKRSSSAALLRPDNQHLKAATDAHAVFGDRRLGNQAWNSDTQLQSSRKAEVQQGDGTGAVPQRPPDRAGISVTDGVAVRSVGRVSGVVSSAQGQAGGRGREEGKVFAAHPFRVEQQQQHSRAVADKEAVNSYDGAHPSRLLKDHHSEKSLTPTSSSSVHLSSSPSSGGQRWANAIPFPTTHRVVAEDVKPLPVTAGATSPHGPRGPHSRSVVLALTDSQQQQQQCRDRPSGSNPSSSPPPLASTHSPTAPPRSRILSDRSLHGEASPTSDSRQRYAEVAPFASDPRGMPGHVRTFSQSSSLSRPSSSSSIRRESAPPSHIPPEAIAMVSPRRKSEDVLSSDVDKESCVAEEPVLISHGRQPSQEELECDQRAQELALEVAESDKKLSDVLNTGSSKKRMEYMNGLFSVPVEVDVKIHASVRRHQSHSAGDRPSFKLPLQSNASRSSDEDLLNKRGLMPLKHSISSPGVVAEEKEGVTDSNRNALDNEAIVKHKEEVMEKLQKKQEMLKEEKKGLQEEIDGNKALGKRLCEVVDTKCSNPSERDKFHTYVSDLEKIVRLLLNLSGQLARAENAVQALGDDTNPDQKKRAVEKCEGLRTKYAEAKQLKEHIDKRSDQVTAFLRLSLSGEELKDYSQFISLTSTLTIHLQQLDDEINLGQEQILELRKSMSEHPSLSPASVPVSS